jgi:hypothetical protein
MSFFWKVRIFFQILLRSLSQALSQAWSNIGDYETIELNGRLYLRFPKAEVTLKSEGGGEVMQSMKLSIEEATQIFQSIQRAYDLHEIVEIKVGELSWITDARLRSNSDEIIIKFDGPLGRTREIARREDVARAIAEFADRFGLK